jgi:hypothetical protein
MKDTVFGIMYLVGIVGWVVGIIIFAPLLTIYTLNTLFSLDIPYGPHTWFAALWLGILFSAPRVGRNAKS